MRETHPLAAEPRRGAKLAAFGLLHTDATHPTAHPALRHGSPHRSNDAALTWLTLTPLALDRKSVV